MTDAQFATLLGAIVAGLGGLATTIRWAVNRVTKAIDDNTESNRELSRAQIVGAQASAIASTKLDAIATWVHHHTPVEMQAVDDLAPMVRVSEHQRLKTAPHGYRPPSRGGHDD